MDESIDYPGWNIFARELASILGRRGLRLGHLNDRAGVHPEKVSRLQRALREPKFNVLSPDDLDNIERVFQLTQDEVLRLRAAILATAIEETLMNRISSHDALIAAQQIFPTLLQAVGQAANQPSGMGAVKGAAAPPPTREAPDPLEDMLDRLDLALLYGHLVQRASREGIFVHVAKAHSMLQSVMSEFDAAAEHIQASVDWPMWRAECAQSLATTERIIARRNG